jgi:hypothetical protein
MQLAVWKISERRHFEQSIASCPDTSIFAGSHDSNGSTNAFRWRPRQPDLQGNHLLRSRWLEAALPQREKCLPPVTAMTLAFEETF